MDQFWKTITGILLASIFCITLNKQEKDISILLSLVVTCIGTIVAFSFLDPVLAFLYELEALASLEEGVLEILLKCAGIGMVSEIAAMVCADSGNSSLAKTVHFLGTAVILYLSLPIFSSLLNILQQLFGEL